ncbi:MAG TPA: tetratricopeptide repeat protein [Pyrinomonadaceae bacterium]|nr:tetratricopeptide repeat protein [Pyrinomonadaceae bacterium]
MTRDNLLFAIIGILLGFILGFLLATNITQREAAQRALPASAQNGQSLPPNHPPINGGDQATSGEGGQQMLASVQEAMKQARENPNDFDAQITAAKMEYQIQRFDQAIEYLLAATKVKPTDFETLAMLGVANLDAGHFDAAEKWYKAALQRKPDDMPTVDGLCAALLSNGNAKEAEQQINKLAKIDPTNQDLPQFRQKLDQLKSSKK